MDFSESPRFGSAKCPFPDCDTKIIPYNESVHSSRISISEAPETVNCSDSTDFFKIDSMWDFDNIGVSRPLPEQKHVVIADKKFHVERYLICSECDKGPLGFAGHYDDQEITPQNLTYFLACSSVKYYA